MALNEVAFLTAEVIINLSHVSPDNLSGGALQTGDGQWFVNALSDQLNEFFIEYGVFTERQIVRMSDAALITDVFLAIEKGVISSSPKDLNAIYKKYDTEFVSESIYKEQVVEAISFISQNFGQLRKSFMMKPYALHSLITALIHNKYGIEPIRTEWGTIGVNKFAENTEEALQALLAMAQAHEAGEVEGPHKTYVWGCLSTTDRKVRRTARVAAILRALGATVSGDVDANLT